MIYLRPASVRLNRATGIDTIVVLAIITALTQIAVACMSSPSETLAAAKNPTWWQNRQLERCVRKLLRKEGHLDQFPIFMRELRRELRQLDMAKVIQAYHDAQDGTEDFE